MKGVLQRVAWVDSANGRTDFESSRELLLEVGGRVAALRMALKARGGVLNERAYRLPRRAVGEPPLTGGPVSGTGVKNGPERREKIGWDACTGALTMPFIDWLGTVLASQTVEA